MDHYPQVKVNERECPREDWASSRHDSASSVNKGVVVTTHTAETPAASHYTSFPSPSAHSARRTDSSNSSGSPHAKSRTIEALYARYTDAPPPYSEKQYEGKSNDEQTTMRMTDYAKELSRIMGKQLVKGLKTTTQRKNPAGAK
ncbi:hypothetical protein ACN47E_005736 [Coniothyrium glycines]